MYKTVKELGGYQQVKIHLLCTDHKITIEHLQLGQQFNKSFHINIFNHNGVWLYSLLASSYMFLIAYFDWH